jgi:Caspase domain/WG containing repeat
MFCALNFAQNLPWLLPPSDRFRTVKPFSEGFAVVKIRQGNTLKYHFLDKQMRLSSDSYLTAWDMSNGLASVWVANPTSAKPHLDGYWRFRSGENKFVGGEYEATLDFSDGLGAVQKDGKWGFIDKLGNSIIDCKYDQVRPFAEGWGWGKRGTKSLILDSLGSETTLPYKFVHRFSEGLGMVEQSNGAIGYIDALRNVMIPTQKDRKYGSRFVEGFAAISDTVPNLSFITPKGEILFSFKNGTMKGNKEGKDITDDMLHNLHPFSNGLAAVRQNGKWGYIDGTGDFAIACQYDEVKRFSEGIAAVRRGNAWQYINTAGKMVREGGTEPFLEALSCSEEMAWVRTKAGWGVLAMKEKLEIVWESPFKRTVTTPQVPMVAKIESYRFLSSEKWELNGKVIQETPFAQKGMFQTTCHTVLNLAIGKNVLKLTVKNEQTEQSNECVLYYQPPTDGTIHYSAVLIANNDYQDSNTWVELEGSPIRDADSLATILQEKYQFRQIFTLRNATLAQMRATFRDLTQYQDSTERILIFYAGHGDYSESLKMAYLVPVDAHGQERTTQFSSAMFAGYVRDMPAQHVLSVIDACFGGSFILDAPAPTELRGAGVKKPKPKPQTNPVATQKPQLPPSNDGSAAEDVDETLKSREIMSSGQRIEVPNESAFKQTMSAKLQENKDATLSTLTLFERLKTTVMKNSKLVPQYGILPSAGSNGGAFIFRKK